MRVPIFTVIVSILAFTCSALFEEQAGEFDWTLENIGFVSKSLFYQSSIVVSTSDGVLAKLNSTSGVADWRVVLARNSDSIERIAVAEKRVFAVSRISSGLLLSSYLVDTGILEWDLKLNPTSDEASDIVDLLVDAASKRVHVLGNNCLYIATVTRGVLEHSYCADSYDRGSQGSRLVLTQLGLPLQSVTASGSVSASSGSKRLAVGCFTNDNVMCGETAIVAGDAKAKTVEVQVHPALPVLVRSLIASTTDVHSNTFASADVFVGSDASSVHLLHLATGSVSSVPVPGDTPISVQLVATTSDDIAVAVSHGYAREQTVSFLSSTLFAAQINLVPGLSCVGYTSAQSAIDTHLAYSSVATAVACVSDSSGQARTCPTDNTCSSESKGLIVVKAAIVESKAADQSLKVSQTEFTTLPGVPISGRLAFASISSRLAKKQAPASLKSNNNALLVTSTGSTLLLKGTKKSDNSITNGEVVWRREESLARVRQTVVLEQALALSVATEEEADSHSMPDFKTRLQLQKVELQEWAMSSIETILDLPDVLRDQAKAMFASLTPGGGAASEDSSTATAPLEGLGTSVGVGRAAPQRISLAAKAANRRMARLNRQQQLFNPSATAHETSDSVEHLTRTRARKFGFNKVAVMLSSVSAGLLLSEKQQRYQQQSVSAAIPFSEAAIRISGVDLVTGGVMWSVEPRLPSAITGEHVDWVHLLQVDPTDESSAFVSLLVQTKTGTLYVWNLDATTGQELHHSHKQTHKHHVTHVTVLECHNIIYGLEDISQIVALSADSTVPQGAAARGWNQQYLLLHGSPSAPTASLFPSPHSPLLTKEGFLAVPSTAHNTFIHSFDRTTGALQTFEVNMGKCQKNSRSELFSCHSSAVASVVFAPSSEAVVGITYPAVGESIDKRFAVLGDDSVLLKYLNQHLVLVASVSPAEAATNPSVCDAPIVSEGESAPVAAVNCELHITLVDSVSAKVIYRIVHDGAIGPIHSTIIENMLAYSFWNTKAKRTELSTVALFEGMIDRYGLTPFATTASANQAAGYKKDNKFSGFTANTPLGVQRTYILPRAVTAISHTTSAFGISNKNILIALAPGQLYSVDMRMVHPRRPLAEPSVPEKEEGLTRYQPYVTLSPVQAVTLDQVLGRGIQHITTSVTHLESTTLVLAHGGLDIYFNRIQSSGGFDLLASDFNHPLLLAILGGLSVTAVFLRRVYLARKLASAWK